MESSKKVIFDTNVINLHDPGFLRRDHGNVRRVRLATDAQEQVMQLQINLTQSYLIFSWQFNSGTFPPIKIQCFRFRILQWAWVNDW